MNDGKYDEKWERRRRIQGVVFVVIAIAVAVSLAMPMMTSLF